MTLDPEQSQAAPAGELSNPIRADLPSSVLLVQRAQKGDSEAVGKLLERYQSRLQRIVRVRLGARLKLHIESVDIIQETFAVAFQKIGDFELRSHASILNWLARIAENQIRDANRYLFAAKRDHGREQSMEGELGSSSPSGFRLAADETAVVERVAKQELRELMDQALTRMQHDQREVILLRDYSAAEWDYIAEALGRSRGACQELHRRAWFQLQALVKSIHLGK
jgi:RNA polymerase sigma-70 factor (subfamily 1)